MSDDALLKKLLDKIDEKDRLIEKLVDKINGCSCTPQPSFMPPPVLPTMEKQFLHVPEQEQDIEWAFKTGMIDKKTKDQLMQELDFLNTDVEIG